MLFLLFFVASIFNFYFFYFYIIKPQSHTNVIKYVNWHLPFY